MRYDDIIDEAAEGFLNMLGSDDLADIWGAAVDLRLTEESGSLPYHEVYRDIFRAALAKEEATVAELRGRDLVPPLTAAELNDAAAYLGNEADRLHENGYEDEAESEQYSALAERLRDVAKSMTDGL